MDYMSLYCNPAWYLHASEATQSKVLLYHLSYHTLITSIAISNSVPSSSLSLIFPQLGSLVISQG
jgi:hypothetical protein